MLRILRASWKINAVLFIGFTSLTFLIRENSSLDPRTMGFWSTVFGGLVYTLFMQLVFPNQNRSKENAEIDKLSPENSGKA